jgi:perosamine synthetase
VKINLHAPLLKGNELKYISKCIKTTWLSSSGNYVKEFEKKIITFTGSKNAVSCINGTAALQVSLRLLGLKPNHEVIVPTITFIAPVNAIRYFSAQPIFMDVDKHGNIDPKKTIEFIKEKTFYKNGKTYNKKTKKIISILIAVHVFGNPADLDDLVKVCKKRNIKILEDASESLGSYYSKGKFKGKHTGTIGDLGCISFNINKIITSGGGGIILCKNKKISEKIRYLVNQAKNDNINFIHDEVGYNYGLSNINAAIGCAQIENIKKILILKRNLNLIYKKEFSNKTTYSILEEPIYSRSNYWINIVDLKTLNKKKNFLKTLLKNNIEARPVWKCNHLQKPYIDCETYKIDEALKIENNYLCLPSSYFLKKKKINKILQYFKK